MRYWVIGNAYFDEGRDLDLLGFSGRLNSQDGELEVLVIQESVDHKVKHGVLPS